MFTVDAALQQICAQFREQAMRGQITEAERDLLIDGAILLAVHLESLIQDAQTGTQPLWPRPVPSRGIGKHAAAIAA
ncbi:MAG TPA: hypothetical protein VF162_08755 [Streptosporangiaceae bacterium]